MTNKRVWPVLVVLVCVGIFFATQSRGSDSDGSLTAKQQVLLQTVTSLLEQKHFSPKTIDDNFSKQVFAKYLDVLDGDKNILLASDIRALRKFETTIDNEMKGSPIQFYTAVGKLYAKRVEEVKQLYKNILAKPFDFTVAESVLLDTDSLAFSGGEKERSERWRKRLKFMVLERYADMQEQREKAQAYQKSLGGKTVDSAGKKILIDSIAFKTDAELEADARQKVVKALDRSFERSKKRLEDNEQFSLFVNTITELMDPHTEYFAPIEKRSFDEQMSGRFFGIGAQLREDDGVIKLASVMPGSPAWKSGELGANDVIIKVAQGDKEPVDITGFGVDDAVKLIRGNKGTEVRLTVKKPDGSIKVVKIIREEIVQDETYARSAIIDRPDGKRIGYIYLPEFYANFEEQNGARCAVDVAGELMKLKSEKVDGVIMDLRSNGGGSLYEVVNMVGLFIKGGPIVQVKDKDSKPTILNDTDPGVLYDGPLAVMVNELSASASEIFAAAIQDYGRGIVVGSTSTYGKGTVQKNIPLGKQIDFFGRSEMGAVKLTFEKFYRVNGGSTQLKGVEADVVLPDVYEFFKIREKDQPTALPWDKVSPASIVKADNYNVAQVISSANADVTQQTNFSAIKKNAKWLSDRMSAPYSLQLEGYKKEQQEIRGISKENEKLLKLANEMSINPPTVDNKKYFENPDKNKGERYQQWLKNLKSDIYIAQTANIVSQLKPTAQSVVSK